MKIRKYIFILIPLIFIGFTACNDRPIFAAIEQEIHLKDFSVEGNVLNLLEKNGKIYAANRAGVYVKDKNSDSPWSQILSTDKGLQKIASNNENIFACFSSGNVQYYNESSKIWKDISGTENIRVIYGDTTVFGYNLNGKKVCKITKDGIQELIDSPNILIAAASSYFLIAGSPKTDKVPAVPAKLYQGTTLKKELSEKTKHLCSDGKNNIFVLVDSKLYYYDGKTWDNNFTLSNCVPLSISYFKERKTVLIGCKKGYTEVKLDTPQDISKAKQINPGAPYSTTPPASYSQYQSTLGNYYSSPILGVQRGTTESENYAVFMGINSSIIQRNTGLWGFYSDQKCEWNRE